MFCFSEGNYLKMILKRKLFNDFNKTFKLNLILDSNVRQIEVFGQKNLGSNDVSTQTDDIKTHH